MARRPNPLQYKQLKYPGNRMIETYLRDLVATGLFGRTDGEVAARLVSEGIEQAIQRNTIKRRDLPLEPSA